MDIKSTGSEKQKIGEKTSIVFVLPSLSGGGAERVLLTISTQFPKEEYRKTLLLLTDKGETIADIPEFDTVDRLGASRTIFSILKLMRYIWRARPNVIFSTLLHPHVAIYLATRLLASRPKLVFRSPNMPEQYLKSAEWKGLSAKLLDRSYRAADLIVAQTDGMGSQIVSKHVLADDRVKIARNPLDTDRVLRLADAGRNWVSPRAELLVVAVGRLHQQKGFDFLLKSFSKVIAEGTDARLQILGADVENRLPALVNLVHTLDIGDRVDFLGFKENPYPYIRNADVLAISSRYEGFPNTLLEAIALETPTVSTRCTDGLDAILTGRINGLLVDFGDTDAFAASLFEATTINQFKLPNWSNYRQLIDEVVGARKGV